MRTRGRRIDPWAEAVAHLLGSDPRWAPIIDRVGPCRLRRKQDRFGTLVRAIIGQQISTRAAETIEARLRELAGSAYHADRMLELGEIGLRSVGLSGVKARYVLNLSEAVRDRRLPLHRIGSLDDRTIIAQLTTIKGIGTWTAEMFLIFALNRPDVLPVTDLGIRVGLRQFFGLAELPGARESVDLTEAWRPFRSVAMWYLWRGLDAKIGAP